MELLFHISNAESSSQAVRSSNIAESPRDLAVAVATALGLRPREIKAATDEAIAHYVAAARLPGFWPPHA